MQAQRLVLVAIYQQSASAKSGLVVGELFDDGPQNGVEDQGFERLVESKAVGVGLAVFGTGKALGQLVVGRGHIAIYGCSGGR